MNAKIGVQAVTIAEICQDFIIMIIISLIRVNRKRILLAVLIMESICST